MDQVFGQNRNWINTKERLALEGEAAFLATGGVSSSPQVQYRSPESTVLYEAIGFAPNCYH